MKLIIHDGSKDYAEALKQAFGGDIEIITENGKIHNCIGCFGCWVKTPAECVIKDNYNDTPRKMRDSEEIIIISECTYGMYSPFVKNILDRSIGYIHPYFVKRNGEMHHKLRYDRVLPMRVYFYGNPTAYEQKTAERIVNANSLNLNTSIEKISFCAGAEDVISLIKEDMRNENRAD